MLEFYFSYGGVLKRLRSGALGGEMDRLAEHFFRLGYKRASAKIYLSRIARFSRFAGACCGPMPIHQDVVDSYLRTFPTDTPRIGAMSAPGHARRVAPERFIIAVPSEEDDPDAPLLASFSDYLHRVRGLEPNTREGVLLGGRRFLDWFRHDHPDQDLEALTAEQVLAAVEHRLSLSATSGSRTAATSHIRTFLRFLYWAGRHHQDLARIVPRTPSWRLAHLPPRLAWDDVRHAMQSAQRRRSASAIEPSCCCSPPRAFATASYAPFGFAISTGVLARFLSGGPKASVIGWCHSSRRPAPHSPITSCALDRGWIVRICSCRSRRRWDRSSVRRLFQGSCGSGCGMAGSNSGGSQVRISCATALLPSLSGSEGRSTRSPIFLATGASTQRRCT